MASTDLKLLECGSLAKPGPIGRLVRLCFGLLGLYYVFGLWVIRQDLLINEHIRPLVWNGVIPGLFLVSYVINIGFSRAWKKWPAIISLGIILAVGLIAYMQSGHIETAMLARTIWVWEIYIFGHLGLSFVLASLLTTPGCEMRSAYHLYSKLTGKPTKEHHCPVGPLNELDKWEYARTRN